MRFTKFTEHHNAAYLQYYKADRIKKTPYKKDDISHATTSTNFGLQYANKTL